MRSCDPVAEQKPNVSLGSQKLLSLRSGKLLTSSLHILAWFLPVLWLSVPRPIVSARGMSQEAIEMLRNTMQVYLG